MTRIILFTFVLSLFTHSDAVKCFNCQAIPLPRDCVHVKECNSGEFCYTEQIVTTSGNVVFNTGCLGKGQCSDVSTSLIGKRSGNSSRRATDLSTCFECCADSFCNMRGCGVLGIPVDQRGPYCYNCDTVLDPKTCEKAAICLQNEVCLLYSPTELRGAPETLYRSKCGTQSMCDEISKQVYVSDNNCSVTCCSTDFCNDECVAPQNTSMTTVSTQLSYSTTVPAKNPTITTESTQISYSTTVPAKNPTITTESMVTNKETTVMPSTHLSSTTRPAFHCILNGGYTIVHNDHAQLCIHVVFPHATWDDARSACKKTGGDLLVLDTQYKTQLIKQELTNRHEYYEHSRYWIGGRDYSTHNNFQWVNNQSVDHSVTDWARDEPTGHTSNEQECIVIARETPDEKHFLWRDKRCNNEHSYICERK